MRPGLDPRVIVIVPLLVLAVACSRDLESVYTGLTEAECPYTELENIESAEDAELYEAMGVARQTCPGIAGYGLVIHSDDNRVSIDVIAPDGRVFPLDYWHVISTHFTHLGKQAEWRTRGKGQQQIPKALIIRVNAHEDVEHPEQFTSYLAVAKITADEICVTDKIQPGSEQNTLARRAADAAANKPCLGHGG